MDDRLIIFECFVRGMGEKVTVRFVPVLQTDLVIDKLLKCGIEYESGEHEAEKNGFYIG